MRDIWSNNPDPDRCLDLGIELWFGQILPVLKGLADHLDPDRHLWHLSDQEEKKVVLGVE